MSPQLAEFTIVCLKRCKRSVKCSSCNKPFLFKLFAGFSKQVIGQSYAANVVSKVTDGGLI